MLILFVAKFDSQEELNMENIMDPEKVNLEMLKNAFMNGTYCKALSLWLPFLNKRGFLDTLLPTNPNTPFMTTLIQGIMEKMQPHQVAETEKAIQGIIGDMNVPKSAVVEGEVGSRAKVECVEE